ncbi:hypothetical protein EMCRGX_G028675 [Ephydatia muelleri]
MLNSLGSRKDATSCGATESRCSFTMSTNCLVLNGEQQQSKVKAVNKSRSTKKAVSTSQCSQDDIKPPYSYIVLIVMAISQSPNKILTCGEICDYIIQQFPYYGKRWPAWQNTIRQTLSLNDCFIKVKWEKGSSSSRRSNLWKLHPLSGEMFNNGSSLRRRHCHIHQLPVKSSPTSLDVIHPPPSFPAQSVKQDSLPSSPMEGYTPFVHKCVTDQHAKEFTRSSGGRNFSPPIRGTPYDFPLHIAQMPPNRSDPMSGPHVPSFGSFRHYQPGDSLTQASWSYPSPLSSSLSSMLMATHPAYEGVANNTSRPTPIHHLYPPECGSTVFGHAPDPLSLQRLWAPSLESAT